MADGLRKRQKEIFVEKSITSRRDDLKNNNRNDLKSRSVRILLVSVLLLFVMYWAALVHYFERQRIFNSLNECSWSNWENWDQYQHNTTPHRIVILADPQLVDDHTYPTLPWIVDQALRKMSDNYLHYNYLYMQRMLDPDTTIFIGDLFDGGRDWEDESWMEEFQRFNRIFPKRQDRRTIRGLPGNHDIGFQNISVATRERFAAHFGNSNDMYVLGNHTFLQIDTISYSHEDPDVHEESRDYVDALKYALDPQLPRILLTHVPLFRDPALETCGPGRESQKLFPLVRGIQYQTVIEHWVSDKILRELKPFLVFSGDDHDYCDMVHIDYEDTSKSLAREITCKSPSMTSGIRYPAYQLLSLNNPDPASSGSQKTFETKLCYLPSPYTNVRVYWLSYFVTCVVWWFVSFRSAIVLQALRVSAKSGAVGSPLFTCFTFILHCLIFFGCILYLLIAYHDM